MEYVAIDFQTANELRASACSVALVTVKDGEVVDVFYSLIRPDVLRFNKDNVAMHGITESMVKDKPYFADLWPLIKEKIKGTPWALTRFSLTVRSLTARSLPTSASSRTSFGMQNSDGTSHGLRALHTSQRLTSALGCEIATTVAFRRILPLTGQ